MASHKRDAHSSSHNKITPDLTGFTPKKGSRRKDEKLMPKAYNEDRIKPLQKIVLDASGRRL